jgi:septum formation protein
MQIVLGSKSSRRKELLELMGYNFIVDGIDIDESLTVFQGPVDFVENIAIKKGEIVSLKYPDQLVITADTIVNVDEEILGKPKNKDDARRMIRLIANKSHYVMTGVYLHYKDYQKSFVQKTLVIIDEISDADIEEYISTNEPYDKAGGYAIQGIFAKHIKKINGDFYNVM